MADDLKIRVPVELDLSNSLSNLKLNTPTVQTKIQTQLDEISKNLKLNIGQIDTSSLNTALSNVQNKVIGTNNGLTIKPVIDGKIIEDTDTLIKTVVGKLQQLNNIDLKTFKDNLKNIFGVSSKEISDDATSLINNLRLKPEDSTAIIQSYSNLIESIRSTFLSKGMGNITDGANFENNVITSIYKAATEYKNLEQTATSTATNIKSANKQVEQSNQSIVNSEQRVVETLTSTNAQVLSFKQSLQSIGMNSDSINSVINRIEKLNVEVTSLSQSLSTTTGKNGKSILNVDVSGVDKLGQAVKFTQQLDVETGNLIKQIDGVATASTKSASQLDSLMAQQTKRKADLTNQINQIYNSAIDPNASRSITDSAKLDELKKQYDAIDSAIKQMNGTTKTAFAESEAEVTKLISKLKSTVQEYRNAENVSTTLKPDKLASAISKAESEFTTLNTKVSNANVTSEKLKTSLGEIEAILNKPKSGEVINKAEIEQVFTALSKAKSELNALVNAKTSNSAVEKVRIQAEALSNELNTFTSKNAGFNTFEQTINGTVVSVDSLRNALSGVTSAADFSIIKAQFSALKSAFESSNTDIKKYSDSIDTAILKLHNLQNSPAFLKNSSNSQVVQTKQQIESLIISYEKLATILKLKDNFTPDNIQDIISRYNVLDNQLKQITVSANGLKSSLNADNSMQRQAQQAELLVEKVKKLRSEIIAYQNANTKAMKSNRTSSNGITYSAEIDAMLAKLKTASSVTDAEFKKISASFRSLKVEIKSVGLEGGTIFSGLIANIKKFTSWMSMTFLISRFTMEVRQAVVELKEIDTVLTEISKTSDRTTESLEKLGKTSFDTASKYGQKASDYLLGVQEMSRAGFGETKSENMAELSTLAQSAGDMTAELANEYLIATNAAYKLNGSVNALTNVLDSQNYVTNRNAVNLTELANATKIAGSQSAVSAVGIDKMTAAVGTMIASTQEGGEVAGRAFKAILMNLQQVSAEADDIGDGGEAITSDSLTKYEKACADLGVSLKTVKDGVLSLRDPMEILEELANSVSQEAEGSVKVANLINAVGGKYRGNQLISLLRNWDTYKKMLSEFNSDEAIGSAAEEAQKTAESWQGMLNALENDWSEFINTIVNSDIAKSIIESARRIISSLSNSTSVLDKGISFLTKGEVSTSLEFVLKQIANLLELVTKLTDKIGLLPAILGGLALKNVGELSLKYARSYATTDIKHRECNTFKNKVVKLLENAKAV